MKDQIHSAICREGIALHRAHQGSIPCPHGEVPKACAAIPPDLSEAHHTAVDLLVPLQEAPILQVHPHQVLQEDLHPPAILQEDGDNTINTCIWLFPDSSF